MQVGVVGPRLWAFVIVLLTTAAVGHWMGAAGAEARAETLVIGRISSHPERHVGPLKALADYLADRLASHGVTAADVLLAPSLEVMAGHLAAGRVDVVSESPFGALSLVEAGLAEPFLREWRKGTPSYHTVFFARRDSGIGGLADLVGRVVAFEDPGSTSGFLLPFAALKRAGLDPVPLRSPRDAVPDGRVGYAFAGDEQSLAVWVARGLADAGAFSDIDWRNEQDVPAAMRDGLVVFHRTEPVMRALMVVRRDMPPGLRAALAEALVSASDDPQGRERLRAASGVVRYDRLTPAMAKELAAAAELRRFLPGVQEAVR